MLIASCFTVFAFAAGSPTVTVSGGTAAVNETVTVGVAIKNNTGFADYKITLNYDETALKLESITAGDKSVGTFMPNATKGIVSFTNGGAADTTGDGVLFTATFTVLTEAGGDYGISADVASMYTCDGTKVAPESTPGTVTAKASEYTVTLPEDGDGFSVSTEEADNVVEYGDSYEFSVDIAEGYVKGESFSVTANGVVVEVDPASGLYKIVDIIANQIVSVNGVRQACVYNVTIPTSAGYTVTGDATVAEGADYTFTVDVAEGYKTTDEFAVTVNGTAVEAVDGVYTVPAVAQDLAIAVNGVYTTASLSVDKTIVQPGEEVTVSVSFDGDMTGLMQFVYLITFDSNLFELIDVATDASSVSGLIMATYSPTATTTAVMGSCGSFTGGTVSQGAFATLTFKALAKGDANFNIVESSEGVRVGTSLMFADMSYLNGSEVVGVDSVSVNVHTHDYASDYDESGHWTECEVEGCDAKTEAAAHELGEWVESDEAGEHFAECECGYSVTADHEAGEWKVTTEATEDAEGEMALFCKDCGAAMDTAPIAVIHDCDFSGEEWYSDGENHWKVCTVEHCGELGETAGHEYGEWKVITEATATEKGSKSHVCKVCGYEETAEIAATGNITDPNDTKKGSVAQTGDGLMQVVGGIGTLAAMAAAAVVVARRKSLLG